MDCPCRAALETCLQFLPVEVPANEHQPALTRLICPPGKLKIAIEQHVHALKHEAPWLIIEGEYPLGAENVRPLHRDEVPHPFLESLMTEGSHGLEGVALDVIVMVVVILTKELRLQFQNTVEIEGATPKHLVDLDPALLGMMELGISIDRPDALLHGRQLVGRDKIGLVQKNDVGKGNLLFGFMRVRQPLQQVLCVNYGDDRIKLCALAYLRGRSFRSESRRTCPSASSVRQGCG
jgi:hypothetical protein